MLFIVSFFPLAQTNENSLKLAHEDLQAMERYLIELGEKCQHAHSMLEATWCDSQRAFLRGCHLTKEDTTFT